MKLLFSLCFIFSVLTAQAEFGLHMEVEDQQGNRDAVSARMANLFVKEGAAVTPFVEKGAFKATFTGKLNIEERSRVYFKFKGRGKVTLTIAGKVALEVEGDDLFAKESARLRLNKGQHDLHIQYESPAKGDAQLRFLWHGLGIPLEPVSPGFLSHNPSDFLQQQTELRQGRSLVAQMNCTKCHSAGELGQGAMPELLRDTPDLANAGNKYDEAWLAAWIQNPKSIRHSATMPRLFKHKSVDEALKAGDKSAVDIAAYIGSLKSGEVADKEISDALAKDGGDVFHKLGCVSCHTRPDKDVDGTRTPLSHVSWKFKSAGALSAFLKNPAQHYKWIRMPDFGLSDDEALKLSAYLMKNSNKSHPTFVRGDAENGKKLYEDLGCASCHNPQAKSISNKSLADLNLEEGCLKNNEVAYDFNESDTKAIKSFLKSAVGSLAKSSPAEFSARQIKEVNCTACHKYDGAGSSLDQFHIESQDLKVHEGSHLDQFRPLLTWMGEKLQSSYIEKILNGENDMRPRPWLDARMPVFKERSKLLAEGFAAAHGLSSEKEDYPTQGSEMPRLGKQLTGTQGGFSCIICHDAGPKKALAAFEVKGIDLQLVEERLRPDYYKRWMLDPARIVPATKMPKFSSDGTTALVNVLEGDGGKQFMAIFEFLKQGRKLEAVK